MHSRPSASQLIANVFKCLQGHRLIRFILQLHHLCNTLIIINYTNYNKPKLNKQYNKLTFFPSKLSLVVPMKTEMAPQLLSPTSSLIASTDNLSSVNFR